ncbi:uncharacterized protein LOC113293499 [Papaver somniferum]|uniref:uncharacterized protein LOC113293499 n=1 Tax=Papaver somniferum TaxID=3469 RepID=UPI000E6F6218|nr:uncharacterized protein LOC113293499 [Papaver somniferum]
MGLHGPRSVHLTGYYLGRDADSGHEEYDDDDECDSMDGISGEDWDSEEFKYDSDNDEYLEDDGEDLDMFPSGKSAVLGMRRLVSSPMMACFFNGWKRHLKHETFLNSSLSCCNYTKISCI